jgi:prolipoprotein diacylglyceryltransferase
MVHVTGALPQYIPSPPISSFHVGPLDMVGDIALWVVPAGIIGGRIYFDITPPADIPHVWYGVLAVWTGGLGIWGGVALAAAAGVWRLRRLGISAARRSPGLPCGPG